MTGLTAFSAASVIAAVAEKAAAALDHLADERGLDDAELARFGAFEALQAEANAMLPRSRSMYAHARDRSTAPWREKLDRCAAATGTGIPLVELLGMRGSVPGDWHRLPLTLDTVLWLGVTRLADDLSCICAGGASSPRRQKQLATVRDLQGALGRVIRLSLQASPPEKDFQRATGRADAKFTRVTDLIGDDLPAIRAEATALRARHR
jgi:hypothetical protein